MWYPGPLLCVILRFINSPKHMTRSGPMLWGEMYKFFRLTKEATANISKGLLEMLIIFSVLMRTSQAELTSSKTWLAENWNFRFSISNRTFSVSVLAEISVFERVLVSVWIDLSVLAEISAQNPTESQNIWSPVLFDKLSTKRLKLQLLISINLVI